MALEDADHLAQIAIAVGALLAALFAYKAYRTQNAQLQALVNQHRLENAPVLGLDTGGGVQEDRPVSGPTLTLRNIGEVRATHRSIRMSDSFQTQASVKLADSSGDMKPDAKLLFSIAIEDESDWHRDKWHDCQLTITGEGRAHQRFCYPLGCQFRVWKLDSQKGWATEDGKRVEVVVQGDAESTEHWSIEFAGAPTLGEPSFDM